MYVVFLSSFKQLQNIFQFIIDQSSYRSMLYSLDIEHTVKDPPPLKILFSLRYIVQTESGNSQPSVEIFQINFAQWHILHIISVMPRTGTLLLDQRFFTKAESWTSLFGTEMEEISFYFESFKFRQATLKYWRVIHIFWDITTCSPLKVNRWFGGTCRLYVQGRRISQARNQRETWQQAELLATFFSETSIHFQLITRRYNPADRTHHNRRCENIKSCTLKPFLYLNANWMRKCYSRTQ
jgi:hypothetical protein